jgi:ABC-type transporter Mla subunit MlaD
MATPSEVKAGLDEVAQQIRASIQDRQTAKEQLQAAKDRLDGLGTNYADVITTIQGYTPTGAFESLAKDEFAKLTTEFQALASALDTAIAAL